VTPLAEQYKEAVGQLVQATHELSSTLEEVRRETQETKKEHDE
jgi:hypothetical protein